MGNIEFMTLKKEQCFKKAKMSCRSSKHNQRKKRSNNNNSRLIIIIRIIILLRQLRVVPRIISHKTTII